MAATYSPSVMRVPSAMGDLTSLFGMGRGEHPRQNHHKDLQSNERLNNVHIGKLVSYKKKNKAYGQLVLLGFTVTSFTPVAYQRHSL